jgi:hypothetical protein
MNEQRMQAQMAAIVDMAVQDLTDEELAALNNCAQLDQNPTGRIFDYEKVSHLFENGKMDTATKEALARVVNRRLGG